MNRPSVRKLEVGPIGTNCYFVTCPVTGAVLVIDPGDDTQLLSSELLRVDAIVYTHGHFDHCGAGAGLVRKFSPATMIHSADSGLMAEASRSARQWGFNITQPPAAGIQLADGDKVETGDMAFAVIHTPGHSRGSICLYGHGMLFSGDTLFRGSMGRTDLPGSSHSDMETSLKRIASTVSSDTEVYPGHGPATTMERELAENPFLCRLHLQHLPKN